MEISDRQICDLLLSDNKHGMDLLFEKYFKSLVLWADTFLNDMDAAKDLVQDFFVIVWNRKTYKHWSPEKLPSYLHVSIKNLSYNKLKKRDVLKNTHEIESYELILEEFEDKRDIIVAKILEEVEKLPEKGREVVKCIYLKGMKYKEAAEELNVSVSTIKTQLVRSLKTIRLRSKHIDDFILLYFFEKK